MKRIGENVSLLFWIVFVGLITTSFSVVAEGVRRLAIDLGSNALKVKIAEVDPQKQKMTSVLAEKQIDLPLRESIQQSGTRYFSDQLQARALDLLREMAQEAIQLEVTEYAFVSTEGLEEAQNARTFIRKIRQRTGMNLEVISPTREAMISFHAVAGRTALSPRRLVVWDLGGGSMELATLLPSRQWLFYTSESGSIHFKTEIIRKVKHLNPNVVVTPNPLSEKEIDEGMVLAREVVIAPPRSLHTKLRRKETVVVGVGSLAYLPGEGITVSQEELRKALRESAGKNDKELGGGAFVAQEVTNLMLALGVMEGFGIKAIRPMAIDLTDGLLLSNREQVSFPTKRVASALKK